MNVINIINMPMPAGEKFWNMIPLGIMGSFCEEKDLIALSSTNKEAVKKMFQIWKKCFEESDLCFFTTFDRNYKVVWLHHFSKVFSIEYQQSSTSVVLNDFDRDVRKYNFQNQIAYNRHVVRLFPNIKFDSKLYKDAWALITQNRIARLAKPRVEGLIKDVFVCNIMSAIAHHHHQLFYLLEGIRTRLLTEEGCKEIVNFFENPPGIVKTNFSDFPNYGAFKKYNESTDLLLAYAVRCGNEEAVKDLLNKYKCMDMDINDPIVIPACFSFLPVSHLPLFHSKDEDEELFIYKDRGRRSLIQSFLTYAAFYGHLPIVQTLIENKANVNISHEFGGEYQHGYQQGYKIVTPLICAVAQQHVPIVQALLDAKADTNLKTSLNHPKDLQCMPLGLAIRVGNIEIVQALLYAKADPNAPSFNKGASQWLSFTSQRLLLKSSPLASAVTNNNPEMVQLLLAYRSDVNLCDKNNFTPLALAAGAGNLPLMHMLLASKADVNQSQHRCSGGNFLPIPTALMIAARMHQLDAIQMLISAKADPNFVANEDTALQVVIRNDARASYKHPELRFEDENEYDEYTSYFREVEEQGDIGETVSRLLELRADPNECSRQRNKYTILMQAAALRELGAVHALLEAGAHCNLVDPSGQTALIHAIRSTGKGNVVQVKRIVRDLLKYGADIHIADKEGHTALSISQSKKLNKRAFEEVAEILKAHEATIMGTMDDADAPSSCRKQKRQMALTQERCCRRRLDE